MHEEQERPPNTAIVEYEGGYDKSSGRFCLSATVGITDAKGDTADSFDISMVFSQQIAELLSAADASQPGDDDHVGTNAERAALFGSEILVETGMIMSGSLVRLVNDPNNALIYQAIVTKGLMGLRNELDALENACLDTRQDAEQARRLDRIIGETSRPRRRPSASASIESAIRRIRRPSGDFHNRLKSKA